ncbi:50S ribosomal protein L24 [Candidatus Nomurabacteria bacterium RIFCSPHIGHO2_02_FULL_38_15]|uniref:Large ribosomal subunit protein uL24 n=1 Tax=Candidatus Nomurabacteria bacterium RIFCSPHIGHO2_02_FULL_38_15 TaxID=1801752 RepID=A0A1F6VQJ0_9BACT|nr:MAG: 50S ribosomal protein L24 [Candidatus Nomurabacteria bacterium RIFCSPHIGHO2_02_FULL_38_15]
MKIKKGDNVRMLTGNDKGKKGKVVKAFPVLNRVLVEGINMVKKNVKPKQRGQKGTVIELSLPVNASNVRKVD